MSHSRTAVILNFAKMSREAIAMNEAILGRDFDEARFRARWIFDLALEWGGTLSHRRLAKSNNSLGRLERNRSLDTGPKCCSWLSS